MSKQALRNPDKVSSCVLEVSCDGCLPGLSDNVSVFPQCPKVLMHLMNINIVDSEAVAVSAQAETPLFRKYHRSLFLCPSGAVAADRGFFSESSCRHLFLLNWELHLKVHPGFDFDQMSQKWSWLTVLMDFPWELAAWVSNQPTGKPFTIQFLLQLVREGPQKQYQQRGVTLVRVEEGPQMLLTWLTHHAWPVCTFGIYINVYDSFFPNLLLKPFSGKADFAIWKLILLGLIRLYGKEIFHLPTPLAN